jgi:diguanylate cyclase
VSQSHTADRRRPRSDATQRLHSTVWVLYGVLAGCLLAYLVSEILRPASEHWSWLDDWGVAGFEVVTSALCFARAFVVKRGRAIPIVLGLSLLAWAAGDIALSAESIGGADPAVPSVADGFYLAFYPLAYVGIMLLVRRQARRFSAATWLDGAVAGLGAATICSVFAFHSLLSSLGDSALAVATNLAYPVGDLLLLVLVVGGTAVLPGRRRARWVLIAAGCAADAVGDTSNLFHASLGSTHLGTVLDAVAWPTSTLLISAAMWVRSGATDPQRHERPPGLVLPAVAAGAALVVLVVAAYTSVGHVAAGLAAATLTFAGIRAALSLMRLRTLTEERHGQAITDELTELGNRRALFELLDGLLEAHEIGDEQARKLAFLFVDLNRFKEVNDSFGHSAGDELLRQLGARLRGALRTADLLVRLGGDEFAVVLLDADADYGATIAQRLSARLEEPFLIGNVAAHISASIGIAVVPDDAVRAPDLLRQADLAMYRAKVDGKAFAIYQAEIDGQGNRLALVEDLRVAIEQRQLELHYQPQVDLRTGEIVAVEALVRWRHSRHGFIPPLEFLPLAEDAGLMDELTTLVLDEALGQCAVWQAQNQPVTVSVNISATNLLSPGFPAAVARLLERHRLDPAVLVLEVTETVTMADVDRCRQAIQELSDLGLVVSVDDFGAGFTSLAYLSSLAVGELKLDRSFINGLSTGTDTRDLALVRSTVKLAHALGLRVVAEGVEDEDSFELLTDFECDLAQGYLISKPQPAGQLRLAPYPAATDRVAEN